MTLAKRNLLKAATVAAVASLVLAGCGGVSGSDGSGTTGADSGDNLDVLTVWFPGANPAEQEFVNSAIIPRYAEETGRDVEITFIPWGDMSTKLNAAFASGTGPDVYGHGPAATADLVHFNRAEPLDDYVAGMDADVRADLETVLSSGQVDDRQYLIPISADGRLVAYNAVHFEEAGLNPDAPPTTFAELQEAAETLAIHDGDQIERAGIVFPAIGSGLQQTFSSLLWADGGEMFSEDRSEVTFNEAAGVEALDYYVNLYQADAPVDSGLGGSWSELPPAQSPLITEDTSMIFSDISTIRQIMAAAPDMDIRVADGLSFDGSTDPASFGGAATGLLINPDSEIKDAGWEFIEFMTNADFNTEYSAAIGTVPVNASAIDSEYVSTTPAVAAAVENSATFRPNPNVVGWTQIRDTLNQYIEQAVNGQMTSQEALDQAATEVEAIMAESGE